MPPAFSRSQNNSTPQKNKCNLGATNKNDTSINLQSIIDTNIIATLPVDRANFWTIKDAISIKLTDQEIQAVDFFLPKCIKTTNKGADSMNALYIDFKKYKRPYVPFVNSKGERMVLVNYFCRDEANIDYWKKELVQVEDGGSCFFHVLINLTRQSYGQLYINGLA